MTRAVLAALCLAAAALPEAAEAAQRYAAAGGDGEACTQAAPCSLTEAMSKAKTGDEVIVGTGTHLLPAAVATPPLAGNVTVHGDFGAPMPRITGSAETALVSSPEQGSRIEYLEIENRSKEGEALLCGPGGRIDRVVAKAFGEEAAGITQLNDCTIRDSVIRADGKDSIGIRASSFVTGDTTTPLRNLTVVATGPGSVGIRSIYGELGFSGSYTVDLRNSIVDAGTADLLSVSSAKGPGNFAASHSSFDTIKQEPGSTISLGAGNQTAAPLFVDAAGGDYRQAPGSPTIDAGTNEGIGALDPLGNPRTIGAAPDIGAYEFVPPTPPGEIRSLTVLPRKFKVSPGTDAVVSFKDKVVRPAGTTVTYSLSAPGSVEFTVERKTTGRKAGKKCVKQTKANRKKKRCPLFKQVKGGFAHSGQAGANTFRFSGRVGGRALKPGAYRLTGKTATTARSTGFRIDRPPG